MFQPILCRSASMLIRSAKLNLKSHIAQLQRHVLGHNLQQINQLRLYSSLKNKSKGGLKSDALKSDDMKADDLKPDDLKSADLKRSLLTSTERDSSLPNLLYLQYPWKYIKAKLGILRLKLFWDRSFKEDEFKLGSTQAAVLVTDLVRNQNIVGIHNLTTANGFKQIARDMILSRGDPRLQLLRFRSADIKKAIPVRIYFLKRNGRKHCVIDMFFVGMRNVKDFDPSEMEHILENISKYDDSSKRVKDLRERPEIDALSEITDKKNDKRRILFAEIFTRFYREYSSAKPADDWSVAYYKVATFDVVNF